MKWTTNTPTVPGYYWCYQCGKVRGVSVWRYLNGSKLFTNEDSGAPVDDKELYKGAKWSGPIEPPAPPTD